MPIFATPEILETEKKLRKQLRNLRVLTGRDARGSAAVGGGWNRKSVDEHLREGTYRADRHGPLAPNVLDYPKPTNKVRGTIKSQRRWIHSEADQLAFHAGCRFNERLALHAAEFFPKFLRHSKGQWAGKPFDLLPWQRDELIMPLFGWVRPDGTRRYRRVFVEIPKKNGKSTLASGIGLYMLCADGEAGAEIYSVASDQDQASIVHGEAIHMADASEQLTACLKINRSTRNIGYGATNSYYRALAANPRTMEGRQIHCCIIDELHIWRGREAWDALRYGFRARTNPLQFIITTAGDDDQSVCYQQLERARGVLSGSIRDDSLLPLIYEAAPEDDWTIEPTWAKANPSLGATFTAEALAEDVAAAKGRLSEEASFKRYTLNLWQKATNPWLSPDAWARNARSYSADDLHGQMCFGGIDLSRTRDMTAFALIFPCEEDGRTIYKQLVRFWLPEVAVEVYKDRIDIEEWKRDGWLEIIGEDYDPVMQVIVEASQMFDLGGIAFDATYAFDLAKTASEEHGVEMFKFSQTVMQFAGPTAEYERLLGHEALWHNGNPILTWQAGHVQVKTDANANKRPIKPPNEDHRKIDGIVAAIMALDLVQRNEGLGSEYEDHGVLYANEVGAEGEQSTIEEEV